MSRYLIRADGGPHIGFGHITRSSALADALSAAGHHLTWLSATPDILPQRVRARDDIHAIDSADSPDLIIEAARAKQASALIGDWVHSDAGLVSNLRARGLPVALVGNVTGDAQCDLFIRQRLIAQEDGHGSHFLDGPAYLLLPDAYHDLPTHAPQGRARRVLISLGGSRSALIDRIFKLAEALCERAGVELDRLRPEPGGQPHPPREIVDRLTRADFAILAGGTSLHEAAACRLPTLCLPIVPRQLERASHWETLGFGISLVPDTPHWEGEFEREFHHFIEDDAFRANTATAMATLVDGHGTQRVAAALTARWASPATITESV